MTDVATRVQEDMTVDEARDCVRAINHQLENTRRYILQLYERRGWAALGYDSWRACVVAEFDKSESYLYRQLQAARTEREVLPIGETDAPSQPMREYHLRQIAQLPPEDRQEIARELVKGNLGNRELRRITTERRTERVRDVRRRMLEAAPTSSDLESERFWVGRTDAGALSDEYLITDLFVTSPPYGLALEGSDQDLETTWPVYLKQARRWAAGMLDKVHPEHGRLCLNIPLDRSKGSREPVYADWLNILREVGWHYESTIVWREGNVSNHQARGSVASPNAPHAVAPVEMILVMYSGQWNLGEPSRPSDIAETDWIDWLSTTWTFAGEHRYRVGHMAPFPEELARRLIQLYSFPGAIIGDPFVGSGTTAVAALKLGRRFRGSDIDPECVELTRARVAREVSG